VFCEVGLARVKTNADGERSVRRPAMVGQRMLNGDCGLDRIARMAERDEEGIALRVDLDAAVFGERGAEQITVLRSDALAPGRRPRPHA
jgi:hypothetical protein